MEEMMSSNSKSVQAAVAAGERKPRPRPEQRVECPRCKSGNTKFCYYNNYSMSQPRYFCKACRRYWTQGGSLRNVPVGGGCRKSKRPAAASSSDGQNKQLGAASSSSSEPPPMGTAPACAAMMDFVPNVLPTYMSAGFEHPGSLSLATFVSASSSNLAAPGSAGTSSFLDVLRGGAGGVLDGGHRLNSGGYYFGGPAAGSGIGMLMTPPAPSFGIAGTMLPHGGLVFGGNGISGTAAAAFQGGDGDGSMMGLQWQPPFGNANVGGGVGSQQQLGTGNNDAATGNNNNTNGGGGGGDDDDDDDGSSGDCYWSNNGGSSNQWQSLINSGSLM
ncbi:uncharacterized protein [Lolium perenne]|uniref:uncharacterized protein n=1 Tax=Lolium perenne TaxID=4522 RepID=UPI0021F53686|nr:dof zinc finger protein 3 [Lolium perenne]